MISLQEPVLEKKKNTPIVSCLDLRRKMMKVIPAAVPAVQSPPQQSPYFLCRALVGHTGAIVTMEFSSDGKFLASGSNYTTVRLWYLSNGARNPIRVHQMKTKHGNTVICLAISSDSGRIFSSGYDCKLLIHDVHR